MNKIVRRSNFESARIICMLMVLACHANGYINEADLVGSQGVVRLLLNQLLLVCVNVFIMISGWFGIKASWKGVCKLLFQVLYITILCASVFLVLGLPVSFQILYALSPILNAFIEQANKKLFRSVLVSWLAVEFIYGFLLDTGHFAYGFSPLSFIGLYLLARYVRLYPCKLFSLSIGQDFLIYVGISLLSAIGFWFGYKWFGMGFHLNHYDSPLAIIASLYFFLAFSKINIQSEAINWLASSAFAIYLVHENVLVSPYYHLMFKELSRSFNHYMFYIISSIILLLIGLVCILVDKPRILLWDLLTKKSHLIYNC